MSTDQATTGPIQCIVVTPEATVLETRADFVALPLYDGELGVARNHSPMIGRLGYGQLRVQSAEGEQRLYVDGGFVQVAANTVSVLTNRAIPSDQVDGSAAKEQLQAALGELAAGDEQLAIRDRRIAQARGQLRVVRPR